LEAVGALKITRVLDIGCGAGQELLPFVARQDTVGVALDSAPAVGLAGRQLFTRHRLVGRVMFVRGLAEALPCHSDQFDLIICRLALPYTRNVEALSEMARVLRPAGLILLKFHHMRFYLTCMKRAIVAADLRATLHAARVLIAGSVYHLTGRQPHNLLTGTESFQTERLLRRELSRHGLVIRNVMPGSTPQTPSVVVVKS
jgi:ubiquinone/menaquinone biosynthesis C-methylase UbiE